MRGRGCQLKLALATSLTAFVTLTLLTACDDGPSCEERGGRTVVDGQHYQPPIYIKVGDMMVPAGGHMVTDSHCEVPQ